MVHSWISSNWYWYVQTHHSRDQINKRESFIVIQDYIEVEEMIAEALHEGILDLFENDYYEY